ncbi:MAG: DHH family phosphoesterase, partial [Clostridia bacterium]|nr:DHH family phosphoesterase [Clostridia bacterium]
MQNNDSPNTKSSRSVNDKNSQPSTYFNYRLAFFLCIAAGIAVLGISWCIYALTNLSLLPTLLVSTVIYIIATAVIILSLAVSGRTATRRELMIHRFDRMLDNMVFPYIITNSDGIIVKHNHAAKCLFQKKTFSIMPSVNDVLPFLNTELIRRSVSERVELQHKDQDSDEGTRYIIIESTETLIGDAKKTADPTKGIYYLTTLIDISVERRQLTSTAKKLENEAIVMGRVEIDDLQAFSNASGISEKEASDKARELLGDWVIHQNGLIYEPETRKFIILMPRSSFKNVVRDNFPILDIIREAVSTKEDELTVSMGFSSTGATLAERMKNADAAFEQRKSGNKAVVNTEGELVYFGVDRRRQVSGGSTEYRRVGNTLTRFIGESGGVLIMGHSRPDYDSIGSALGIARLVSDCRRDWHIVMNDMEDENFTRLTEDIRMKPEYEGRFICEAEALELVRSNTLLIVTDVNAVQNMESPAVFKTICETTGGRTVILDHHETKENTAPADLAHIDTSYSSASELVSGILEIFLRRTKLTSEEATILLAGIMLDTKNFTQYATAKTYAAAEYLSRCSAKAERAKKFFDADYETFASEYALGSNMRLISDGRIALCSGRGLSDETKTKIVIGRVADRLLNMEGVLASIVIAEDTENGRINASARSNNNIINCAQLF